MKKIAQIVSTGEYSGAEKIVIEICDNLKNNYEFTYVCKPGGIEKYLISKNIEYILYRNNIELINILRKRNFDIVHAHDYKASIMSALFFKGKVLSHIHNNTPFAKTLNIKSIMFFLVSCRIEKILCVSNSIINEMYFKDRFKNKIQVVYNWVNIRERRWDEDLEKNIDILFIGRFTQQKDPLLFLDVIKEIKKNEIDNIKVKMVGRGELKEKILNYIKEYNLKENIEVLDFTIKPHMYMKQSKIFFVPSKWEGFGLVFLEAMVNDCAVVATSVGGIREILKDDLECLSNDRNKLVDIITNLLINKDELNRSISKNERILSRFDMNQNINKLRVFYD